MVWIYTQKQDKPEIIPIARMSYSENTYKTGRQNLMAILADTHIYSILFCEFIKINFFD